MKRISVLLVLVLIIQIFITPAFAANDLSDWAQAEVNQAIEAGLIPSDLQNDYQSYCSRENFCRLVVALVEANMGKAVSQLLSDRGISVSNDVFSDTSSAEISAAYALGIVNGVGNNMFSPKGLVTREQAAVMLMRAANVLGYTPQGKVVSFSDRDEFSAYAVKGIDFVAKAGVMNGVENNKFAPGRNYTHEMACVTMLRLYNQIDKSGDDTEYQQQQADSLSAEEIFKRCSPSVFSITVYNAKGQAFASGSGFFIKNDGTLVTNFHVIEGAASAKIKLSDGRVVDMDKVLAVDVEKDLAVLKADVTGVSALAMGNSDSISSGQKVYAIGSPLGLKNSISDGIVSNPFREEIGGIQITAAISSGSSGGALIDEKGNVIGVTFAGMEEGQNLNFAIPINYVKALSLNSSKTFSQLGAEIDKYYYLNRAGMFEDIYLENEPNNSEKAANNIYNGYSVSGAITDAYMDVYSITCNTKGTVRLYLASESSLASDLVFAIAPEGKADSENLVYAEEQYSNGIYCMTIEYPVEQVGDYTIYIMSGKMALITKVNIEYLFYYEFEPA